MTVAALDSLKRTSEVEDGSGTALDTSYYRYYTAGQANGCQGD